MNIIHFMKKKHIVRLIHIESYNITYNCCSSQNLKSIILTQHIGSVILIRTLLN